MKSLLKIYGKYIGITWAIILFVIIVNIGLFLWVVVERTMSDDSWQLGGIRYLEETVFGKDAGNEIKVTQAGEKYLQEKKICFLLILNDAGDVIYSWNSPEGFENHYTAGEIASFSRWYLHDYPVRVWRGERGLLVAGYEKNSMWKYTAEVSMDFLENMGRYFLVFLYGNLLVILIAVGVLGYRYYLSLRPLSEGIGALAANRKIHLNEKGTASVLAVQINQASDILEKQRLSLERRDTARTEWIAGVSHDIRTPLSVIMGYADELEQAEDLSPEKRRKAEEIKLQSLKIKQLIEDLNLTSKLEYHMQPLRIKSFYPAAMLRELAAELLNTGLSESYEIYLDIQPELEKTVLKADEELLARAMRNLLNNSIRHNPGGCEIHILGYMKGNQAVFAVRDSGKGIPDEVVRLLQEETGNSQKVISQEEKPHIMGLRIVKQIALAHKGDFAVTKKGHCVTISFPTD
ncbi:MAG: sensor histidine kinase [Lachnospiraceae bacterium]|nr:sensor histidine kinase [Lachnospiraceae bacterium]